MSVMIIALDKFRESFNFVYVSQTGSQRVLSSILCHISGNDSRKYYYKNNFFSRIVTAQAACIQAAIA